ncbi:osiris 22 [Glossina fuscipes fuscipes]
MKIKRFKSLSILVLLLVLTDGHQHRFSDERVNNLQINNNSTSDNQPDVLSANDTQLIEQNTKEGRSIAGTTLNERHAKPLRSVFMNIYNNYKSTYLGNKTLTEYKQTLRKALKRNPSQQEKLAHYANETNENLTTEFLRLNTEPEVEEEEEEQEEEEQEQDEHTEKLVTGEDLATTTVKPERIKESKMKYEKKQRKKAHLNTLHYNMGPGFNLSLDMENSIVKVKLDGNSLNEIMAGRWLMDNSEEGRGKKYNMVTKILPLFILPFLIQSSVMPFLITKLKLLLVKSMLIGKLAIFLVVISAFRANANKAMQTYEVPPNFWAGEPSRKYELTGAASHPAYSGYRVDGKPAWIN